MGLANLTIYESIVNSGGGFSCNDQRKHLSVRVILHFALLAPLLKHFPLKLNLLQPLVGSFIAEASGRSLKVLQAFLSGELWHFYQLLR